MKRLLATLMCLIVLGVAAIPAGAQTRSKRYRNHSSTAYSQSRYDRTTRAADDDYYGRRDNRSVWQKHRDKITTAGGAVGGAILGGLIGGKKGAAIGAITGGGGAAVYTYKIRKKDSRPY